MFPVLLGERQRDADLRPRNAQRRIVEPKPPVGRRAVEVVALVTEERIVLKNDEAMGKPARDVTLPAVFARQMHGDVPPERRRPLADVNGHVPNRPADDAHELRLRVRRGLPVQAAHHALRRKALVVLNKIRINAGILVTCGVVLFDKPSARITEHLWLDDLDVLYFRSDYFHGDSIIPFFRTACPFILRRA